VKFSVLLTLVLLLLGCQNSDSIQTEWRRIEAPLVAIDPALRTYAQNHGMSMDRNHQDWPERSLTWGGPVKRLIQIYLEDKKSLTFNLWICASEDRGKERYWKNEFVKHAVSIEEISNNLPELLEVARTRVEAWKSSDLVFANALYR
jgi:hypothetical protein